MPDDLPRTGLLRIPTGIVVFLGLQQGVVPLVARGMFGRDQRFSVALRLLPPPWWWIACLGVVVAAVAAVVALEEARARRSTAVPAGGGGGDDAGGTGDAAEPGETRDAGEGAAPDGTGTGAYDALSAVVFLAGIYNGVAPFVARLVFGEDLLLALPLRLPAPWWWITSLAVLVVAAVLLVRIDEAKQRHASGG